MCSVSVMPLQLCNMRCDMFALSRSVDAQSCVSQHHLSRVFVCMYLRRCLLICSLRGMLSFSARAYMPCKTLSHRALQRHRGCAGERLGAECVGALFSSCSCKRHALHALRVRWCAQAGRVLPKNSGTATLQLRKSLETSGRALTQKRKMQGHLGKRGSVFCPPVLCAGLARATFWGRFLAPLFSCVCPGEHKCGL